MQSTMRAVREHVSTLPGVRHYLNASYRRRFFAHTSLTHNMYRGVYPSFAEALSSVPTSRASGYDNPPSAELYRERTRRVYLNDYPIMLWLSTFFESGSTSVFDLGGHIGIAYYAYQRYVRYPAALRWLVHDVPAVTVAGRAWAESNDEQHRLHFTDRSEEASGADILFAAGSLQYLDYTLADFLSKLPRAPRHLLLNSVPIHMSASYFTVQNMGTACCPYRITAEREFIHSLKTLGYGLKDRWENQQRSCLIPFHPDHSLDRYFGFCFSRDE
ncbi:putative methyltransferase, LIC12133 family [Dyella sp. OK004]|uniref:TIGR04325 family methyltransferase n=1 Tax=Dyella sp. OK004 TaxID=1855292 RepID=UPI0008F38E76|nr:TIGR04325 family methyltransferase [Dyella sp. OK004]SFS13060.1 putative methyltransferase, LIC12133 family [Dyella sp. OK004]